MIKKWKKSGPEKVIIEKFGKFSKRQYFIDPRDGSKQEYIFVGEQNSVGVVALTKDNRIILTKQFMQAANEVLVEVPAGVINKNETPLMAAKRELEEETGYGSRNFKEIGKFMRSTRSIPTCSHCFLATDCRKIKNPKIDNEEDLQVIIKPFENWLKEIRRGETLDCLSVIATFLAENRLKDEK